MANPAHLKLLVENIGKWNEWREQHSDEQPDLYYADFYGYENLNLNHANLSYANLSCAGLNSIELKYTDLSYANLDQTQLAGANLYFSNLSYANLSHASLFGADLTNANLFKANLSSAFLNTANLSYADLSYANLSNAMLSNSTIKLSTLSRANLQNADLRNANLSTINLSGADLSNADLSNADLSNANLRHANLSNANLTNAKLLRTDLAGATLSNCRIYGIAAWNVELEKAAQNNLIITEEHEATITIDNLKVAQFVYLLLNNGEIRDVINTITMKAVLILGRFTPKRKAILDSIREALRAMDYLPILFDFEKPKNRNLTETVKTLAHLSRFIIADLTEPSSIPHELQAIIPTLAVPVQPILLEGEREYAMFVDFSLYTWVLPIYFYKDQAHLLTTLQAKVIEPAEQKAQELEKRKNS